MKRLLWWFLVGLTICWAVMSTIVVLSSDAESYKFEVWLIAGMGPLIVLMMAREIWVAVVGERK